MTVWRFFCAFLVVVLSGCSSVAKVEQLVEAVDPAKAMLIASVYYSGRNYNSINHIPIPGKMFQRNSTIVLKSLTDPGKSYRLSGVKVFSVQVPPGEYYISSIETRSNRNTDILAKLANVGRDNYSNHGYLKVEAGELIYLGHIQTHFKRGGAIPGVSSVLHPKYLYQNKMDLAREFVQRHYPELAENLSSRTFDLNSEVISQYAQKIESAEQAHIDVIEDKKQYTSGSESIYRLETEQFLQGINQENNKNRIKGYQNIFNSWTTDEVLFDVIEDKIDQYLSGKGRFSGGEINWAAKALGGSGNKKYQPILERLSRDGNGFNRRRWARNALEILQERQLLMAAIGDYSHYPEGLSAREVRVINMLGIDDESIQVKAARMVVIEKMYGDDIFDALKKNMLLNHKKELSRQQFKVYRYGFKAFLRSGKTKYLQLLPVLVEHAEEDHLGVIAEGYYLAAQERGLLL